MSRSAAFQAAATAQRLGLASRNVAKVDAGAPKKLEGRTAIVVDSPGNWHV